MEVFLAYANLEQDVQCSLCIHKLIEPKLLQCFHTFCKSCIQSHAQLKEQVHIFKCPTCSSETLLQDLNNVENLQPSTIHSRMLQVLAFLESEKSCSVSAIHSPALWHCSDCDRSLCDECLKNHSTFIKDHQVVSLCHVKKEDFESILKRENPCKTHLNQSFELFCKDCNVLVCLLCMKNDHKDHKTMTLQEFKAIEKDLLSQNLKEIDRLRCNAMEKKQQEEIANKVKSDGKKAKEEVNKTMTNLIKAIIVQRNQLMYQIQRIVATADRNLRVIRHTPAAQEYFTNIMVNGIASDMFKGCKNLTYQPYSSDISGIVFCPNMDLRQQEVIAKLGSVRFSMESNPILSEIKVDPELKALSKAKLSVLIRTSTGNFNCNDCDVVDIQISPAEYVKVEDIKAVKTGGKIEVEFMPRVPGQFTAEVKLNGIPVSNSPLMMDVKPQEMKVIKDCMLIKTLNTGSGNFTGIAVNKTNSKIAVADWSFHCVKVFKMDGRLLLVYGRKGSKQKQLLSPRGLAFLNDVDLVIVDSGNNRLCVVNTVTGTLVKTFGCQGNGNGEFSNPGGVHVDDDCNIIVSDTDNGRIQVFTKDGDYQYQFIVPNQDSWVYPHSTVTHNGLFYVSERRNGVIHVIQMKDGSPTRLSTIGQLQNPRGLAIDNDNNLLVCDSKLVRALTLNGHFMVGKTSKPNESSCRYITMLNNGQLVFTSSYGVTMVKH